MKDIIFDILDAGIEIKRHCIQTNIDNIIKAAAMLAACIESGNKIIFFGNGGSAADAQHLAAELVNRFQIERPPLAAIALTTDTSILTSIGNDHHFDQIFAKQIHALGKKGDIAWGISTSGNSPNVLKAVIAAQKAGLTTIALTGRSGKLGDWADLVLSVESDITARIQETHIMLGHIVCDLLERKLYPEAFNNIGIQ
jgi:D-sedoheptulose 7-phosphate isomerase